MTIRILKGEELLAALTAPFELCPQCNDATLDDQPDGTKVCHKGCGYVR